MYSVSDTFKDYIKRDTVSYSWYGTIVDKDSNTYDLDSTNIDRASGKIIKRCGNEKLSIGTSCASELELKSYLDVNRYLLYDGTVTLYFRLYEGVDANDQPIHEDVPMGTFTISECEQSNGQLHIIAYDDMLKFDKVNFAPINHTSQQLPYAWLVEACTTCGVTLGNTQAQIKAMPNGKRYIAYADISADVKTWRDVLNYISGALNGYCYIGRDRKLYIGTYTATIVATIASSFRYSSDLSDYRTTYNGIYQICRAEGIQEYVANENEDGLILDLGTNPFLQFTKRSTRISALREIINAWNDVYYVPFKSTIPIMPHYDIGDVIKFKDNQADEYDYGALTEIVYSIGGKMSIACTGENPRLADAQDRFAKTLDGLSSEYSNSKEVGGKDFWIISTRNTEAINVSDIEVQIAEIEWTQSTYFQDIEMILLIDAELSATSNVVLRIDVDDNQEFEVVIPTNKALKGVRPFHGSNPQKIGGKGSHVAKVYMTVTDSPLTVGDLR